jgi:hypothetical protein
LGFIENEDAARDIVKLATPTRFRCEQGLKQLNVRRDDDWCIPVFGSEAAACRLAIRVKVTVVLKDVIRSKNVF